MFDSSFCLIFTIYFHTFHTGSNQRQGHELALSRYVLLQQRKMHGCRIACPVQTASLSRLSRTQAHQNAASDEGANASGSSLPPRRAQQRPPAPMARSRAVPKPCPGPDSQGRSESKAIALAVALGPESRPLRSDSDGAPARRRPRVKGPGG